jgi:transposase
MRLLPKGITQAEVARLCEVSRQKANNWEHRVSGGMTAEAVKPGPKSKIDGKTFAQFEKKVGQQLRRGEHVTLETAGKSLKREFAYKLARTIDSADVAKQCRNTTPATV